jgi:N-acetylmuramoyl-L-alanine amidase
MGSLETLLKEIFRKWNIPVHRVLGHSDISPGRKIDPGRKFDWERLSLNGLAVYVEKKDTLKVDQDKFVSDLKAFGYNVEIPFENLLLSFRLRFNPLALGALNNIDATVANELAVKYPVDVEKNNI